MYDAMDDQQASWASNARGAFDRARESASRFADAVHESYDSIAHSDYGSADSGSPAPHSAEGNEATARRLPRPRMPKHPMRWVLGAIAVLLVCVVAWPLYLINYGDERLNHVAALSGAANTPGTTYLIVGSDKREIGAVYDPITEGQRADTMMLLHVPESGNPALVSLPRDSFVKIPDHRSNKLNAAYSEGGPKLLVKTIENLSGLTIDHYVEVSMLGVQTLVDAVDGVNLCYDADVNDADSGMVWSAGCHDADGPTALAFSRMRKSDPLGDIGRTMRQRQVVSKLIGKATSTSTILSPSRQKTLVGATADNLTTDTDSSITSLGRAGLAMRKVMGVDGLMGVPPISDVNYRVRGQSMVLLDENRIGQFFEKLRDGQLTAADFNQF